MDDIDKKILNLLQNNFHISYKELGNKVKMAASSVHNRVQKMVDEGIIKKEDTIINPMKAGFETIAIIGLSVDPLKMDEVANKIANYNEVQLIATTTGDHDIVARIIAENEKTLWRFINEKIKTIDGVKPQMDVSSFIDIFKMSHKVEFKI
ncbi:MAG: Lrp/AsnC family transcriptional regulator [Candidatus Thorarchaeota archaeon]